MSFNVNIKTVTQQQFEITVNESDEIKAVCESIIKQRGLGEVTLKLIHKGKQLHDDKLVSFYEIKANDTLIMVAKKLQTAQPLKSDKLAEKAAAPSSSSSDSMAVDSSAANSKEKSTSSSTTATTTATTSTTTPATANTSSTPGSSLGGQDTGTIENLKGMGFTEDQIGPALRAAFGDAGRAVEYLLTGIPSHLKAMSMGQPAAQTATSTIQASATEDHDMEDSAAAGSSTDGARELAAIASQPQFMRLKMVIQQNPAMLEPLLMELGRANPDILLLINENQEAFLELINSPLEGAGAGAIPGSLPPGSEPVRIQVTQEEKAAIDRLTALGFSQQAAMEAYFVCDKNEEQAADYLFNSFDG